MRGGTLRRCEGLAKVAPDGPASPHCQEPPIVSPPQVEHHRWQSPERAPRGPVALDEDTRALLRAWRQRPMPREPWRLRLAAGVVLALHGLFAAVVWWEMRPQPSPAWVAVQLDTPLHVRLIERPRAMPSAPSPPHVPAKAPSPPAHEPPSRHAMTARLAAPPPTPPPRPALQLFDRTGQPLLPATAASTPGTPGYVQRLPQGDSQVMRHDSPIPYHATRFEQAFPSPHETLLGQAIRRAKGATHTGEHASVNLGHGVHLKCTTLFGIPTPMCKMPPAPPSRKDGDERLDMAPAAPLAKELKPPSRSLSECIAAYRAGKPLPQGCPVDTPDRAVDAECDEMRRGGGPLPLHCAARP